MTDSEKDLREQIDAAMAQMKALGLRRADGGEITRADAAKILTAMSRSFSEMGVIMQEAFAQLQRSFTTFAKQASELGLLLDGQDDNAPTIPHVPPTKQNSNV
jgi:hypothetical protein